MHTFIYSLILLFVCYSNAHNTHIGNSESIRTVYSDHTISSKSGTAFTTPTLLLQSRLKPHPFRKAEVARSKVDFNFGHQRAKLLRSRYSSIYFNLHCHKPDSEAVETTNQTSTRGQDWNFRSLTADIDSELMKNDISLISIYSLGDSIIEVRKVTQHSLRQ